MAKITRLLQQNQRERVKLVSVQHHHHKINDTYHCRRAKQESLILVYNQDSYLMAEYSERTGKVSWQRVVPVTQREAVERWLNEQYPVKKAKAAATK
jgi:hypothetical protein